jgi:hypothetical protein
MKREVKIVQSMQIHVDYISFHKNIIHKYKFKRGSRRDPVLNYLLLSKSSKSVNKIKNSIKILKYENIKLFIKNQSYKKNKNYTLNQDVNNKKQFNFIKSNNITNSFTLTSQLNSFYYPTTNIQKKIDFIKLNNTTFQRINRLILSLPSNSNTQNNILDTKINYQKKIDFIKSNNITFQRTNRLILPLPSNSNTQNNILDTKKNYQKEIDFIKSNNIILQRTDRLILSLASNSVYLKKSNKIEQFKSNSNTQNNILDTKINYQKKINYKIASSILQLKTIFLKTKNISKFETSYEKKLHIKVKNQYSNSKIEQKHVNREAIIIYAPNQSQTSQQQKEVSNREIKTESINGSEEQIISPIEKIVNHFHHNDIKKLANKIYPVIMKKWQKEFEKRGVFHV